MIGWFIARNKRTLMIRFNQTSPGFRQLIAAIATSTLASSLTPAAAQPSTQPASSNPTAPSETVADGTVLPSTLVNYIHTQNYLQPDWSQRDIAKPLIRLARTEGLNGEERFFWAQLNFMAFNARTAYALYEEFLDRDDWYGWMARQRYAIMETRAFEDFEKLEQGVSYERKNFSYAPEFASITGFGERSLCTHWAESEDHARAVKLAVDTIKNTPRDAAYGTLALAKYCFASFEKTGREAEAFSLAQSVRDELARTLEKRAKTADQHPAYDPELLSNRTNDGWYGRSLVAPYNHASYRIEKMIDMYDAFLSCHRDKDKTACSD